jgi:hypothetical protein
MNSLKSRNHAPFVALGVAAVCLLATAPTGASAQPDREGEVGRICVSVVGVQVGEKHYASCVQSLSQSLQGLREGEGRGLARGSCLALGYRADTSGLAECELAAGPAGAARGPDYPAKNPGGSRSYFMVSREMGFQRDQLACARLGFEPTQSPFGDCAADLRAALARASNPAL